MALSAIAAMQMKERREKPVKPACACPLCGHEVTGAPLCLVDEDAATAIVGGVVLRLTQSEAKILGGIMRKYPSPASRWHLMDCLYTVEADKADTKIIDVYICKLRRRLAGSGVMIHTDYGFGFRIGADTGEA